VTGPGWLGLAQPMWAELGPAQKIKCMLGRAGPSPAQNIKIIKIKN